MRQAAVGAVDELTYSASNVLLTILASRYLGLDLLGQLNLVLVLTFLSAGAIRGSIGESAAISAAEGELSTAEASQQLVQVAKVAVFASLALTVVSASLRLQSPLIVLVAAGALNALHAYWRTAAAGYEARVRSLASSSVWLAAQVTTYAVYWATIGRLTLSVLVGGWVLGMVLAAAPILKLLSDVRCRSEVRRRTASPRVSKSQLAYALDGVLAFSGPQLVVLIAAAVIGLEGAAMFRLAAVVLGPVALVGSGIRLALLGSSGALVDMSASLPIRVALATSVSIAPVFAALTWLVFPSLAPESHIPQMAAISMAAGALAWARTISSVSVVAAARLRAAASARLQLRLRVQTFAATALLAAIGGYWASIAGAIGGAALAAIINSITYLTVDAGLCVRGIQSRTVSNDK